MASFTITVPDAVVSRIETAYGSWVAPTTNFNGVSHPTGPAVWTPATPAQVGAILKGIMKTQVQTYEARLASQSTSDSVSSEVW